MARKLGLWRTDAKFVEFVIDVLNPLGHITARSMFGGHALYCDGVIFALVADGALFLKTDDCNRPKFEARGLKPFQPFPDKPSVVMSYFQTPPELFESREDLMRWGRGSVEAGQRARKPRRKKAARPPK